MKILIAIPSKDRTDILGKNAWEWAKLLPFDVALFVEPQEYQKYSLRFGSHSGNTHQHIVPLQDSNRGLGYAKQCIQAYALKNGYEIVFKIDDDVAGFSDFRNRHNSAETASFIEARIRQYQILFRTKPRLGVIGFPYEFQMFERKGMVPTKRVQTAYICRTDLLCPDPEISVFEDFAVGINALVKGSAVIVDTSVGIQLGVGVGKGTGGHQSFNRLERAKKEVDMLRRIYPPLQFKEVEKDWGLEPDLRSIKL